MGSSLSSYYDDEVEYERLCKKKGIKPTYDFHHRMWVKYSQPSYKGFPSHITLSWEEYQLHQQLRTVRGRLEKLRTCLEYYEQLERDSEAGKVVNVPKQGEQFYC